MLTRKTRIEFARAADVPAMARLSRDDVEQGLGWRYTPQRLAWLIRHRQKNVVVARIGDRFAGFGIMTYRSDQANLDLLAVKARFRRNGVGRLLVGWLSKVALTAGIYGVSVQVRESNAGALLFYRDLGFEKLDILPGYYSGQESAVILARPLRSMINAG